MFYLLKRLLISIISIPIIKPIGYILMKI